MLLLIFLFFPTEIHALEKKESRPGAKSAPLSGPRLVTMNFQEVELGVLIKFISELTGKNFLIDPGMKGKVTIISPEKVTLDEAYKVFLSVLEVNGYTAVPAGKIIKIIKSSEAKGKALPTILRKRVRIPDDKIITQLLPLKYSDADVIAKLLRPLIPKTGLMIPYRDTNTLIIIDARSNIKRLIGIINELDVPGYEEENRVIPLEYARAEELAPKLLNFLVRKKKKGRDSGKNAVKILTDDRTNTLIVRAAPPMFAEIYMLIDQLDIKLSRPMTNIHIYRLENAVAEEIVKVLSQMPGKGSSGRRGKKPAISKDVQISFDKATNALVIMADPEDYAALELVIKELDIPRTMVFVEVLIVEVTTNKALDLGVQWRAGDDWHVGFKEGGDGGTFLGGSTGGTEVDLLGTGLVPSGMAVGVVGRAITLGDLVFPSFGAFVRAVRSDSDFNIISTPQILTLDNEEAVIEVGQNIPFVTRVDQPADATQNAIQSFEYKDVGVTLKVTPHINKMGFVRLKLEQSVRSVIESTALGGTVLAPTTTFRSARTTIVVKDGETAVIGGLIEQQMNRGKTQTPCLGNIPLLGWLFKSITDRDAKTNVIKNPREAKELYEKKKGEMDEETEKAIEKNQPELLRRKSFK
jgi:general secretion pathway protein D